MATLTSEQCTRLLAAFQAAAPAKRAEGAEGAEGAGTEGTGAETKGTKTEGPAAVDTWAHRLYAPMHVHAPWMADVRAALGARYPAHVVAFDVLFATAPGARVAWHCDYDSLGPFEVGDANAALRDDHFVSVHFNLTRGAGALRTLPWRWLSYLHYWVIVRVGIFHAVHLHLNRACAVLFALFARTHPPTAGVGNAFANMRLHAVDASDAARVSYVVRLVRRDVLVGVRSLAVAATRSGGVARPLVGPLADLVARSNEGAVRCGDVPWGRLLGRARGPGDDGSPSAHSSSANASSGALRSSS